MSLSTIARDLGRRMTTDRPPGPRGLPILGPLRELKRAPLAFMVRIAREYGDVVYTRFAGMPTYLVSHPDGIEHVLRRERANYPKSDFGDRFRPLLGNGLLTSRGADWVRQRKMMSPTFHHRRVQAYGAQMSAVAEEHLATWADGAVRSTSKDMMKLTLDVAVRTLFGAKGGKLAEPVQAALHKISVYFEQTLAEPFPIPLSIPTPTNRAFCAARAELEAIVEDIIRSRRASATSTDDLLSMMLELVDDEGRAMSDRQLRDEVLTLLLAGHETTALTLTYALDLLGRHPEEADAIAREVRAVVEKRPVTVWDLPKLEHTARVIKEALRLYPPASVLLRQAVEDDRVMGWMIPRGSTVVLPQWVVHRDARWFDAPEAFRPARWTPEFEARLPRFAYFPFGGGPRICIGSAFAALEAKLVLATIVRRFVLEPTEPAPLRLVASITVRPRDAVRMRCVVRVP